MVSGEVSLSVNEEPIDLNDFVEGYIDHVVGGIIASLKGAEEIKSIDLAVQGDRVTLVLNNKAIPLNLFASRIILSTIMGVVSSLKGVRAAERIRVIIRK
jgi:hypothetical protein